MRQTDRWMAVRFGDYITVARDYGGGMGEQPDEDHLTPFAATNHKAAFEIARQVFARRDLARWNESVKVNWKGETNT